MRLVCLPTKLGILGLKLKVNIIYPTLSILVYIYICYHLVKLLMLVVYLEFCKNYIYICMCQGLNSHYFHIIGDLCYRDYECLFFSL